MHVESPVATSEVECPGIIVSDVTCQDIECSLHARCPVGGILAVEDDEHLSCPRSLEEDVFQHLGGVDVHRSFDVSSVELVLKATVYNQVFIIMLSIIAVEDLAKGLFVYAAERIILDAKAWEDRFFSWRVLRRRGKRVFLRLLLCIAFSIKNILRIFKHARRAANLAPWPLKTTATTCCRHRGTIVVVRRREFPRRRQQAMWRSSHCAIRWWR